MEQQGSKWIKICSRKDFTFTPNPLIFKFTKKTQNENLELKSTD